MAPRSVQYGREEIRYEVITRPKRRTLGIEVHPDGKVLVLAPSNCDEITIEDKMRHRARWISRQLRTFKSYEPRTTPRQYLAGESHRYLGRQYRLRLVVRVEIPKPTVKLMRGELIISGPRKLLRAKIRELLRGWYLERARELYQRVLLESVGAFGRRIPAAPRIAVREMRGRWGSLSERGLMTLNAQLIQAPRLCIEYVIVHELCHTLYRNHGPAFFRMLKLRMPDWEQRKQKLERAVL